MPRALTVDQECPQCGAPVVLEETHRMLECPFCRVRLLLTSSDVFTYYIPAASNQADDCLYVPYWRFRGMVCSCLPWNISCRVIDTTLQATTHEVFPHTLGLRPQAMRLRFVNPETRGTLLSRTRDRRDLVARVASIEKTARPGITKKAAPFYRECIGETESIIYAPFFDDGSMVYDAITQKPAGMLSDTLRAECSNTTSAPSRLLHFVPSVCPRCGWDLTGDRESIVLFCTNCSTAWELANRCLRQIDYELHPSSGDAVRYVPFWKMTTSVSGVPLASFADLARFANLPRVIRREWEEQPAEFWSPAFKVQPRLFLRLSKMFTINRPDAAECLPELRRRTLCPVTLPIGEAAESIVLTLAGIAGNKKNTYPLLDTLNVQVTRRALVLLPFREGNHDLIAEGNGCGISKNAMRLGAAL